MFAEQLEMGTSWLGVDKGLPAASCAAMLFGAARRPGWPLGTGCTGNRPRRTRFECRADVVLLDARSLGGPGRRMSVPFRGDAWVVTVVTPPPPFRPRVSARE